MKKLKVFILLSFLMIIKLNASAQIGYQVSLLNTATGEPRANERVTVNAKITDSEGKTVCEEIKNETSNDFGVISMSIGDSETFANADWSKLPFFIEASVDSRLLGKSQLLSVPVAEYAKHTGSLTKEILCSKEWVNYVSNEEGFEETRWKFMEDGSYITTYITRDAHSNDESYSNGIYHIDSNNVHYSDDDGHIHTLSYSPVWNCLFWNSEGYVFK